MIGASSSKPMQSLRLCRGLLSKPASASTAAESLATKASVPFAAPAAPDDVKRDRNSVGAQNQPGSAGSLIFGPRRILASNDDIPVSWSSVSYATGKAFLACKHRKMG